METLTILPDQDGYGVAESPDTLLSVKLDGGPSRTRLDVLDAPRVVALKWTCSRHKYNDLIKFFGDNLGRNREQFLTQLIASHAELEEYECRLIPDTFRKVSMTGFRYVVSAQFEVIPTFDEYIGQTCEGGFQDGNGWPDVVEVEPPLDYTPAGTVVFRDDYTGTGNIEAHAPDIAPIGTAALPHDDATSSGADLTGTQLGVPGTPGSLDGIVSIPEFGTVLHVLGKAYIEFQITKNSSGNNHFVLFLDFGTSFNRVSVLCEDSGGAPIIEARMNGDTIGFTFDNYYGVPIRVEFMNGAQEFFVDGVSKGTSTTSCGEFANDASTFLKLQMYTDGRSIFIPFSRTTLVDYIEFGSV